MVEDNKEGGDKKDEATPAVNEKKVQFDDDEQKRRIQKQYEEAMAIADA